MPTYPENGPDLQRNAHSDGVYANAYVLEWRQYSHWAMAIDRQTKEPQLEQ